MYNMPESPVFEHYGHEKSDVVPKACYICTSLVGNLMVYTANLLKDGVIAEL